MAITYKDIREKLKDIDEFLLDDYKKNHPEQKRDWRTYEEQYALRIKEAMKTGASTGWTCKAAL